MKRYIQSTTKSGNSLIGQRVLISDRYSKYFGNWAVVREFDGQFYYVAVGGQDPVVRVDRHDFTLPRDSSKIDNVPKLSYEGSKPNYLYKSSMNSNQLLHVLPRFLGDRIRGMHDAYCGGNLTHVTYDLKHIRRNLNEFDTELDSAISEFNDTYGTNITYDRTPTGVRLKIYYNVDPRTEV